jgi:hypothetical protein
VIFDGANSFMASLDDAMSASNNLIVDHDPGVVNLAGTTPEAFDLVEGSEAIDQGLNVPGHTLDFLNRTAPDPSGLTDIGAFESGSAQGAEVPEVPEAPDAGAEDPGVEGTGEPIRPAAAPSRPLQLTRQRVSRRPLAPRVRALQQRAPMTPRPRVRPGALVPQWADRVMAGLGNWGCCW